MALPILLLFRILLSGTGYCMGEGGRRGLDTGDKEGETPHRRGDSILRGWVEVEVVQEGGGGVGVEDHQQRRWWDTEGWTHEEPVTHRGGEGNRETGHGGKTRGSSLDTFNQLAKWIGYVQTV